jgi:hypothetical protein
LDVFVFLFRGGVHWHWLGLLSSGTEHDRLVWDRLPWAMMFMALFTIIVGERLSQLAAHLLFFTAHRRQPSSIGI